MIVAPLGRDFSQVTAITHAGDARLFVGQRTGEIYVIQPDGSQAMFIDLSMFVQSGGSEYGLYDIAFHPDFAVNGLVYVSHTRSVDNRSYLALTRFRVEPGASSVDMATRTDLLLISQWTDLHKGGGMDFDQRTGVLFMGTGEDKDTKLAQDPSSPKGKVLRLEVADVADDITGNAVGEMDVDMWALGFRNPWRVDVDEVSGLIYIADVGSGGWEEVSAGPIDVPGANFGWPCKEGPYVFPPGSNLPACLANPELVEPLYYFGHDDSGRCAIIGGSVYRPAHNPDDGRYIFGDLCTRTVFAFPTGTVPANPAEPLGIISDSALLTFGEGNDGTLYAGDSATAGPIYKLTFPPTD